MSHQQPVSVNGLSLGNVASHQYSMPSPADDGRSWERKRKGEREKHLPSRFPFRPSLHSLDRIFILPFLLLLPADLPFPRRTTYMHTGAKMSEALCEGGGGGGKSLFRGETRMSVRVRTLLCKGHFSGNSIRIREQELFKTFFSSAIEDRE